MRVAFVVLLTVSSFGGVGPSWGSDFRDEPRILLHQWGPERARPKLILDNLDRLERELVGIDGFFLFLDESSFGVMSEKRLSAETIRTELKPLAEFKETRLRHNLALVFNDRPADLFDDWTVPLANWETFATVCREAGLAGIAFDNEEYAGEWADYPQTCRYRDKSLNEYRDQARKRGAEVMKAVRRGFPNAVVVTLHGPTLSADMGPPIVYRRPNENELWGPFFAGMLQERGEALVCDGGELYGLRTRDEFRGAYHWRKWGIASTQADTPFIPASLRREWPAVSLSWGVYDAMDGETGRPMDAATSASTLAEAFSTCDHFVWMYYEEQNLLTGDAAAWKTAIAQGRKRGQARRTEARGALKPDTVPRGSSQTR